MLNQIKYFQAVVQYQNFTKAAEQCYVSQSAISQQIQALENELGVKLLYRENRKFSLTPAGSYFYKKSLVLTSDFERLCRETKRIAGNEKIQLHIGYLKNYGGQELQNAVIAFSKEYPDVEIELINGNHEDLYDMLRFGTVDFVLNDQRRAFSDEYVNFELTSTECYIEIAARNPISQMEKINIAELKDIPCILIASASQQDNEMHYYRDVVGFAGEFLFAENLEEARLMVVAGKGFIPIEGGEKPEQYSLAIQRILLCRNEKPMKRNYCAFWKHDNTNAYVTKFADILKFQFFER